MRSWLVKHLWSPRSLSGCGWRRLGRGNVRGLRGRVSVATQRWAWGGEGVLPAGRWGEEPTQVGDATVTDECQGISSHLEVGTYDSGLGWGGGDHHRSSGGGYSVSAPEADVRRDRLRHLRRCGLRSQGFSSLGTEVRRGKPTTRAFTYGTRPATP